MAFFEQDELKDLYTEAQDEAREWRRDYDEYERLADNGLLDVLDDSLPEVNDGSLAASLFKLPKRIISSKLTGRAKALDADDAWVTELANIYWEKKIIPNANSQAPFHRKWKDAVRKAAIYGGQPIITLFVNNGDYSGSDIIIPHAQDVKLEPGKVSDLDSDAIMWDVYYTKKQVRDLIEQAEAETKDNPTDGYNKWDIPALKEILKQDEEADRDQEEEHDQLQGKAVKRGGIHFCIVFQRGVEAPFYMYHKSTNTTPREWTNPDPSGDIPVHYLYCYQDFVNPYGVGIVKLAGGTQNVLDYMRKADVLATQLGLKPPKLIAGDENDVDEESLVYAEDAHWYVGAGAQVTRLEMASGVYNQLPVRQGMYKTSLSQFIPTGDSSISAESGDPNYSKTPAGVKFQAANLSIDDEDFKDNTYMTYEMVARSMINTQFANMQGTDLMKLSDDEREKLAKAGLEFYEDAEGKPTNELEVIWDNARATFDFEVEPEIDQEAEDAKKLEGGLKVLELRASDPTFDQSLMEAGYKFNMGEHLAELVKLISNNDKIIQQVDPDEMEVQQQQMQEQQMMQKQQMQQQQMQEQQMQQEQMMQQQMAQGAPQGAPQQGQVDPQQAEAEQYAINLQAVMQQFGVDESTAMAMLEAESQGFDPQEILQRAQQRGLIDA